MSYLARAPYEVRYDVLPDAARRAVAHGSPLRANLAAARADAGFSIFLARRYLASVRARRICGEDARAVFTDLARFRDRARRNVLAARRLRALVNAENAGLIPDARLGDPR